MLIVYPSPYPIRTFTFEIVTLIWIDDYFDNYRDSHNEIFQIIKQGHTQLLDKNQLIMLLRDMIGLNNSIEMHKIFKFHYQNS